MAQVKKLQPSAHKARKSTSAGPSKSKAKDKIKRPPPKQVKTKRAATSLPSKSKPKKPQYTDAQLNLPAINSIIPASAAAKSGKGTGKKRNKIYVDDTESMMTILAMVNAEKEGQIESKVLKARQLEEIREARKKEAEKRAEGRREKLEDVKKVLKRKSKGKVEADLKAKGSEEVNGMRSKKEDRSKKKRKSVSFA